MRSAMETEALYASEFPFVEYGIDLDYMAEHEKGIELSRLNETPSDVGYTTVEVAEKHRKRKEKYGEWYEENIKKLPVKNYDRIPIGFHGKSQGGYMLYDIVQHKGESGCKLNWRAQDLIRYYGTDDERRMNRRLTIRMKIGGPRFAMMNHSRRRRGKARK